LDAFEWFVGIDWATRAHQVCLLRAGGGTPEQREFPHTFEGLAGLSKWLEEHGTTPAAIAVAIEVPHGAVVETLLERGIVVYSLNPKQLDRFRDRHTVAGAKDDRRDAYVLADALRTDLHLFKRAAVPDATRLQLRELSRCYDDIVTDLNRVVNRLREQVHRFAPQLLDLCPSANEPWFWDLVELGADPIKGRTLRKNRIQSVLTEHRKRSVSVDEVVAAVRTPALKIASGALAAALEHIWLLLPQVRLLHGQAAVCKHRMAELTAEVGRPAEVLMSHPGIATIIAATLLAEASEVLADGDLARLRVLAGTAPVTRRSGKACVALMRRACNSRVRHAVRQWAFTAARTDPYAHDLYRSMRERGLHHERALRGVGDRLLACLVASLRDDSLYDPNLRARHLSLEPTAA
jgi:transposase